MGGGGSLGLGFSKTKQDSFVDPTQAPFLAALRQGGQGLQQQLQGGFEGLGGLSQNLLGQGQGFLGGLQGAGAGLSQFIGSGPVDQQIGALTDVSQQFVDRNLNTIAGNSNLAGQFGGGRSQVQSGAAIGQGGAQLGLGIGQILQQDFARQQQAAAQQGALQNQGNLGGLSSLGQLFGLGEQGLLSQFGGFEALQGLVGAPTVLGSQRGKEFSFDIAGGGGPGSGGNI